MLTSNSPFLRWRGGGRGGYDPSRPRPRHQGGGGGLNHHQNNGNNGHRQNGDRHMPRPLSGYHHQQFMGSGGHHFHHPRNHHNAWNAGSHAPHFQEQHVPVKEFNAAAARDLLKQAYNNAGPVPMYRPPPAPNTKGSPWGSKPNCMANGRDFFLELRKQVSALQQDTAL
ncbi:hypothetical protein KEM56_007425 [Ascosphaera pollenicola]|nr:hypothetical protein KEM56_007425 [Ascosphaera pollenicola]